MAQPRKKPHNSDGKVFLSGLFIVVFLAGFAVVTSGTALADGGETTLAVAFKLLQGDTAIVMQSIGGLMVGIFHGIAKVLETGFGLSKETILFFIILIVIVIWIFLRKD